MKKLLVTGAAMALALGAFAQGTIYVGNDILNPYICKTDAATHYNGAYTLQVWELNGTIPAAFAGITGAATANGVNPLGVGAGAYNNLAGAGFKLEKTYTGTMSDGIFALGTLNMADVSPAGATVTLALAFWDNQNAWSGNGGLAVFVNPTSDPTIPPPGTPTPKNLTGWDALGQNLVMTPIPEPSTFALAGLGAAALLIFRRRK